MIKIEDHLDITDRIKYQKRRWVRNLRRKLVPALGAKSLLSRGNGSFRVRTAPEVVLTMPKPPSHVLDTLLHKGFSLKCRGNSLNHMVETRVYRDSEEFRVVEEEGVWLLRSTPSPSRIPTVMPVSLL